MEPPMAGEAFPHGMIWRRVMAGFSGRWLVTASLVGILGSPLAALAQAGRPWVDPPSEAEAKAQAPMSAPSALPPPPTHVAGPSPVAPPVPSPAEAKASAETQPPDAASPRKTANDHQTKQKAATARKTRASSQQANASARSQRREGQVAWRRATAIERRARITRYGSVQEGLDAGLQVMRLRTIQLPDGRRIDVLTRPDQDIASGLPDGY
jgi:type IV secretory pathway VirB10-like protein